MKYIKVEIQKTRIENQTFFSYPKWYDIKKFNIVSYQNEWFNKEYAIATTDNSFTASEWLEEVSKQEAKDLIADFVTKDKDIKDEKLNWKTRDDVILNKQKSL